MAKISVLGAGSWGTALSILLYNNGHEVILWSALGEEITTLREKREHVSKRLISQQILREACGMQMWQFWQFLRLIPEVPASVWRLL